MERVILRHLRGSKASEIEEFPLDEFAEMILGRDPGADVRFDPEDDVVGRRHARIVRDPEDRYHFTVVDLNSRNGTFVNKQRVTGSVALNPGDVVQLGAGGPEIQFDIDPLPPQLVKATRLAVVEGETPGADTPPTRASSEEAASGTGAELTTRPFYGKETVLRIIGKTRRDTQRNLIYFAAAVLVVIAGAVAWETHYTAQQTTHVETQLNTQQRQQAQQLQKVAATAKTAAERSSAMTPAEIAAKYSDAVVEVDFSWKLINTWKEGTVYHEYVVNKWKDKHGTVHPFINNGQAYIPAYIQVGQQEWEPLLTMSRGTANKPIGVAGTGSGFVVNNNGYILTDRHVAANWRAPYEFDAQNDRGILVNSKGHFLTSKSTGQPVVVPPPDHWIPSETKQPGPKSTTGGFGGFQGQLQYLYVSFPKNTLRRDASVKAVSDRHDMALIKVDVPTELPSVQLYDNYDKIAIGDPVTVLGYPSVSPEVVAIIKSKDMFNREAQQRLVPDPTLSVGNIGKILRAADGPVNDASYTFTPMGDVYELTINSTGAGNSGGPMFDAYGRVIGMYFADETEGGATVGFAVPIRYGLELMSVSPNTP